MVAKTERRIVMETEFLRGFETAIVVIHFSVNADTVIVSLTKNLKIIHRKCVCTNTGGAAGRPDGQ